MREALEDISLNSEFFSVFAKPQQAAKFVIYNYMISAFAFATAYSQADKAARQLGMPEGDLVDYVFVSSTALACGMHFLIWQASLLESNQPSSNTSLHRYAAAGALTAVSVAAPAPLFTCAQVASVPMISFMVWCSDNTYVQWLNKVNKDAVKNASIELTAQFIGRISAVKLESLTGCKFFAKTAMCGGIKYVYKYAVKIYSDLNKSELAQEHQELANSSKPVRFSFLGLSGMWSFGMINQLMYDYILNSSYSFMSPLTEVCAQSSLCAGMVSKVEMNIPSAMVKMTGAVVEEFSALYHATGVAELLDQVLKESAKCIGVNI